MQLLRNDWFWRALWAVIGFSASGLAAHEAMRSGSAADLLGALGFSAWTVIWIILPTRLNLSFRENVRRNSECLRRLPLALKSLIPVGFLLILASLVVRMV